MNMSQLVANVESLFPKNQLELIGEWYIDHEYAQAFVRSHDPVDASDPVRVCKIKKVAENQVFTMFTPVGNKTITKVTVSRKTADGEYIVRAYIGTPPVRYKEADYYTTDLADAHGTAKLMWAGYDQNAPLVARCSFVKLDRSAL
jgi:hypothetical protein